jgi:hypothetical protein
MVLLDTDKKLQELEKEFKSLADKVYEYRKLNDGLVPFNIFPYCLEIGVISSVVEMLLECYDESKFKGYALKKREKNESGWQGFYHIPGTVIRINDNVEKIFQRLNKEIWKKEPKFFNIEYFGNSIHHGKQKRVMGTSRLYVAKIDYKNLEKLSGKWQIFKGDEKNIVEHHKEFIKWREGKYKGRFIHLPPSD